MVGPTHRYEVEIHLHNGKVIVEHVTESAANTLAKERGFTFRAGMSDEDKQIAAIVTLLAHRLDTGTGLLSVIDPEGRQWLIPAKSVACGNVKDLKAADTATPSRLGFEPLLAEQSAK
jgi:hypothetical protein